ncbi:MAG: glutathione S-transferase [Alphaproteobacteria bacterium]
MSEKPWIIWGIDLSLFTGKLEAIFRAKGIDYNRHTITARNWAGLATKVGVHHMPYAELPNGDFLSDTTLILRWLEDNHDGPALTPAQGHVQFISRLIEDWADEYLWRPAMYYRWRVPESRHMQAWRIIQEIKPPFPMWLAKRFVIARQYGRYVVQDGVRDKQTRAATEKLYHDLLGTLDAIFEKRPYLMGERPTDADFGLFAPFFRHFFGDPVPSAIMQDNAPHVLHWCTRMWAAKPSDFENRPLPEEVPDDLAPILNHIAQVYLPYLQANAKAVAAGEKYTRYEGDGAQWKEFAKPFRLWCLSDMQNQFAALDDAEQQKARAMLGDTDALTAPLPMEPTAPPSLPITPGNAKATDSWLREK